MGANCKSPWLEPVLPRAVYCLLLFSAIRNAAAAAGPADTNLAWAEDYGTDMFPEKGGAAMEVRKNIGSYSSAAGENSIGSEERKAESQEEGTSDVPETAESSGKGESVGQGVFQSEIQELSRLIADQRKAMFELDCLVIAQLQKVQALASLPEARHFFNSDLQQRKDGNLASGGRRASPQPARSDADQPSTGTFGGGAGQPAVRAGSAAGEESGGKAGLAWAESFQVLSNVKVDADVSCLQVVPQEGAREGLARYLAVGDASGKLHFFLPHGGVLVTQHAGDSVTAVTAMLSLKTRRNETWLIAGHADGAVFVYRLDEKVTRGPAPGQVAYALDVHLLQVLIHPPQVPAATSNAPHPDGGRGGAPGRQEEAEAHPTGTQSSSSSAAVPMISILEAYRLGSAKYIIVGDVAGGIRVFRSNGSLYGAALSPPGQRPLAFLRTPASQHLLFLTPSGAGSLDMRSMRVHTMPAPCEGLNGSAVGAYWLDAGGRSRAYGLTANGAALVYVVLSGDTLRFRCQVRARRDAGLAGAGSGGSGVALAGLRGYLLAATTKEAALWNISSPVASFTRGGPRHLSTSARDEIAAALFGRSGEASAAAASSSSLSSASPPASWARQPVLVSNGERLVAVGLGGGRVGIFESRLPSPPPAGAQKRSSVWGSPLFVALILLVGGWQFISQRRGSGSSAALGGAGGAALGGAGLQALPPGGLNLGEFDGGGGGGSGSSDSLGLGGGGSYASPFRKFDDTPPRTMERVDVRTLANLYAVSTARQLPSAMGGGGGVSLSSSGANSGGKGGGGSAHPHRAAALGAPSLDRFSSEGGGGVGGEVLDHAGGGGGGHGGGLERIPMLARHGSGQFLGHHVANMRNNVTYPPARRDTLRSLSGNNMYTGERSRTNTCTGSQW
eukprot:jgi/Mesen1/707/ME000109S_10931